MQREWLKLSIPENYANQNIWLTIDIEEITDTNFNIRWKRSPDLDYEKLLLGWMELCKSVGLSSTCFVLGSFAKKYPEVIKRLHDAGHEIASHGLTHELVYKMDFTNWQKELSESKALLESITGSEVKGYRSPSWSLPFKREYYKVLLDEGFTYSSSYFPMKTYMYGNSIDKKKPFDIEGVTEIPLAKNIIPFSGGLYLRALPVFLQKIFKKSLYKKDIKTIIYVHPYELIDLGLFHYFSKYANINLDYFLAFYSLGAAKSKIKNIVLK